MADWCNLVIVRFSSWYDFDIGSCQLALIKHCVHICIETELSTAPFRWMRSNFTQPNTLVLKHSGYTKTGSEKENTSENVGNKRLLDFGSFYGCLRSLLGWQPAVAAKKCKWSHHLNCRKTKHTFICAKSCRQNLLLHKLTAFHAKIKTNKVEMFDKAKRLLYMWASCTQTP